MNSTSNSPDPMLERKALTRQRAYELSTSSAEELRVTPLMTG